jgi:hypothetical protein
VGCQQTGRALVAVAGSHLVQERFHTGKALLEFFDRKAVERRAHHDARLKLIRGLQVLYRGSRLTKLCGGVGEILQSRSQELAFASKVAMQQAVVHTCSGGDFTDGRRGRTLLRKQLGGRLQDGGDDLFFANWLRGVQNRCLGCSHLCTVADNEV